MNEANYTNMMEVAKEHRDEHVEDLRSFLQIFVKNMVQGTSVD